jgi:hypothetical protein
MFFPLQRVFPSWRNVLNLKTSEVFLAVIGYELFKTQCSLCSKDKCSTFLPHTVVMCFIRLSEYSAALSDAVSVDWEVGGNIYVLLR